MFSGPSEAEDIRLILGIEFPLNAFYFHPGWKENLFCNWRLFKLFVALKSFLFFKETLLEKLLLLDWISFDRFQHLLPLCVKLSKESVFKRSWIQHEIRKVDFEVIKNLEFNSRKYSRKFLTLKKKGILRLFEPHRSNKFLIFLFTLM